jgi:hypothetical protein
MDSQCADGKTFSRRKMIQDIYPSRTYLWIRRLFLVSHGVAYSSRTYLWIRRLVLVSLGIVILLGDMFGLEEWFLYHYVE